MAAWVRQLLGLTILAGALEFLLPDGKIRGFSRMILGLVLVLTMANPLLSIKIAPRAVLPSSGERQTEAREDLLKRVFDLRLRQELAGLLQKHGYACLEAKAAWDEEGKLKKVEVELAADSANQGKATGIIAKHLGLAPEAVSVVEGGN